MVFRTIEILLVEDNPGDVRLAQETLREHNIQNKIHVLRDGEAALAFVRQQGPYKDAPRPDMILLDMTLPKVDGLEVVTELQADRKLRDIPLVVLAASEMDRYLLKEFKIATDCFVLKPLTLESYLGAVRCFPHLGLSIVSTAAAGGE